MTTMWLFIEQLEVFFHTLTLIISIANMDPPRVLVFLTRDFPFHPFEIPKMPLSFAMLFK